MCASHAHILHSVDWEFDKVKHPHRRLGIYIVIVSHCQQKLHSHVITLQWLQFVH